MQSSLFLSWLKKFLAKYRVLTCYNRIGWIREVVWIGWLCICLNWFTIYIVWIGWLCICLNWFNIYIVWIGWLFIWLNWFIIYFVCIGWIAWMSWKVQILQLFYSLNCSFYWFSVELDELGKSFHSCSIGKIRWISWMLQ